MSGAPGAKDSPVTSAKGPSFVNIGPMAAGPSDVLFIGDSQDVSVYALELGKFAQGATPGTKNVAGLKPGADVRGVTIGEFGNMNRPLDMIVYTKDGKDFILMSNNMRGVMKVPTGEFGTTEPILKRAQNTDHIGVVPEAIPSLKGVEQLDLLDSTHGIILARNAENGSLNLEAIALP